MKYTQSTLDKLEKIVEEAGYVIRYERGTFQSGYCLLEQKKVVVLNKFLQTEGRINTLIDLIPQLDIQPQTISEESKKIYLEINSKLETKENK
jgi:molybdopterin-guanine dinucleotide biosynthesis protein A